MTIDTVQSPFINDELTQRFSLQGGVSSTRSADLQKGARLAESDAICLWVGRANVQRDSASADKFAAWMQNFAALSPQPPLLDYGIDRNGKSFAAFGNIDGDSLRTNSRSKAEAERRFTGCLRAMARLHEAGLVSGEICPASFWAARTGEVYFIGVMGASSERLGEPGEEVPQIVLPFVSPEQWADQDPTPQSDVFALGVLGYVLLKNAYPFDLDASGASFDFGTYKGLTEADQVPAWAPEVLERCLAARPEERFANAAEVLEAINYIRQHGPTSEAAGPASTPAHEGASRSESQSLALGPATRPDAGTGDADEGQAGKKSVKGVPRFKLTLIFLAVFVVSLVGALSLVSGNHEGGSVSVAGRDAAGGNPPLRGAINVISEQRMGVNEKAAKLEELVRSDDPLAHDVLVRSAVESATPEMRNLCEKAIVDRVRRLGRHRSAEQVRQWLRTVPAGELPPSYEPLLKSLNGNLPNEARDRELREAYATNPKTALRFTAALALDSADVADFQTLMAQLVGDSLAMTEASGHAALSLILAHADLATIFGDDVVQRRSEIPDGDIVWLLKLLAERNDMDVRAFANLAVERDVLSPLRASFLSIIRDRDDLPTEVVNSLVKAAAGALTVEDVGAFGKWFDTAAERLLLGICADVKDDQAVLQEAFDVLAGKSLTIQPSATLVDWVRRNYWDNRIDFARPAGVLANLNLLSPDEVRASLLIFDKYVKDKKLINLLITIDSPVVTGFVLEKYGNLLSMGIMLNLLGSPEKDVRLLAIRSLAGVAELGASKIIIDHYEREKDDDVRNAYRQTFWFIQNRK